MYLAMLLIFVIGYLAIALEHPIHIDKSASALLIAALTWVAFILGADHLVDTASSAYQSYASLATAAHPASPVNYITHELRHHLGEISEILFFLMGAMTIVELVDVHGGFDVITNRIKTRNKSKLMWIICVLTFFLSAALDNLTTSIVMISLLKKLIDDKETRWLYSGMVIIAANAGGAWSPIGDVTTTMLWIGGQVTAAKIIVGVIIPSLVCMLVPLGILTFTLKGEIPKPAVNTNGHADHTSDGQKKFILFAGVLMLINVPIFKTVTHLPPYMGMLFGLGVMWLITELMHKRRPQNVKDQLSVIAVLKKIEISAVLFFLGILLAIASLQSAGHLTQLADLLRDKLGNMYAIDMAIGLLSAIVDNVPLVAGAMGMYTIEAVNPENTEWMNFFVQDGKFWEFLAYCAGCGGSALIIGSAAGVAVMGLERMDFIWYLKKMSLLAVLGYFGGAAVYILMN